MEVLWLSNLNFWLLLVFFFWVVGGGLVASGVLVAIFFEWLVAIFWMVGGGLVAGGILVVYFSSLCGDLGDGWWWFVQQCLHLVGWELQIFFFFFILQLKTLKNDFHCIFKLATNMVN